jgi:hypothetical protein
MNFETIVRGTQAFKSLSLLKKEQVFKRCNRKHLEHGVNVASYLGLEQWEKQTLFNAINTPIVKEIITNNLMPEDLLKVPAKIPAVYE